MPRWIPKIENTNIINKSQKGLLQIALDRLGKPTIFKIFKDSVGIFAYETQNYILVARNYIYGFIISIHKSLVETASMKKKPILVYIDRPNKFYMVEADEILENNTPNVRGDEVFLNFDIRLTKAFKEDERKEKFEEHKKSGTGLWKKFKDS
jgi:hypothetical protein